MAHRFLYRSLVAFVPLLPSPPRLRSLPQVSGRGRFGSLNSTKPPPLAFSTSIRRDTPFSPIRSQAATFVFVLDSWAPTQHQKTKLSAEKFSKLIHQAPVQLEHETFRACPQLTAAPEQAERAPPSAIFLRFRVLPSASAERTRITRRHPVMRGNGGVGASGRSLPVCTRLPINGGEGIELPPWDLQ